MNHAVIDTAPTPASASTPASAPEGAYWNELVTAALLGAERRTPPGGTSASLLDAAAVETVRQRAGLRPAAAAPRPEPAPEDRRPPLPAAADARLRQLLTGRRSSGNDGRGTPTAALGGGPRGSSPDPAELLPEWLATAVEYGYRPPAELVPPLLDAARARTDLRQDTLSFTGPLGRWLARHNPDWKFALRNTGGTPAHARSGTSEAGNGPGPGGQETVQRLWQDGLFAERVAVLTAERRRSPAEGLALLASTWESERAEDRLMFVDSLRETLSGDDEPFLEKALTDRSRTVRATAAELLSAIPESALAARMAARARTCVTLDSTSAAPRILVEAPYECDAPMQRDGVTAVPPPGRGERAWWLAQLVESTPLTAWSDRFGGRSAAQITALPVTGGRDPDLHGSWCRAAVRQRNAEWARALIGPPGAVPEDGPGDAARLLTVLPREERALWTARFIAAHGLSDAFRVLGVCAVPWSGRLGRSVVDALEIARDAGNYPWSFSAVLGLAERCLDPGGAEGLAPLAAVPEETENGAPGAGEYWAEAFQRLVAALRLRAAVRAELLDRTTDQEGGTPARP